MKVRIYVEGSSRDSRQLKSDCRQHFHKLLKECGFESRQPMIIPSGSRTDAFNDFKAALRQYPSEFVAMWIDSEDRLEDLNATWQHLKQRPGDQWTKPTGATNDQVLFMTTCMETMICADPNALKAHYGHRLQLRALPSTENLENCDRQIILDKLTHATRNCSNAYAKGKRSFEILAKLSPGTLAKRLPSFQRSMRILEEKLPKRAPA